MPELYPEYDYQDSPERNEMNDLMRGYDLSGSEEIPLDENYPTLNQIKWMTEANAAGYDPVLEVQILRDKVMFAEAAAKTAYAVLMFYANKENYGQPERVMDNPEIMNDLGVRARQWIGEYEKYNPAPRAQK